MRKRKEESGTAYNARITVYLSELLSVEYTPGVRYKSSLNQHFRREYNII